MAPNAQAYRYPSEVDGQPAPQRYSLIATDKSLIVHLAAGVAYRGIKCLSIGGTVPPHGTPALAAARGALDRRYIAARRPPPPGLFELL